MQQMGINKLFFQGLARVRLMVMILKLVNNFISLIGMEVLSHQLILLIQIDGTMLRSPLMEQITNCILME
jgi:hypothetical protein